MNSSPRPRRRSTRRRSTKPASLDSRPSTSSSCSPAIATTSTPRSSTPSRAELCCHTLLIDEGSRHRSYCLLLLSHVDVDEEDLREQAVKYGLEDVIDALLQYLETQGEVEDDRLLAWSEFQKLAGEYKIER